MKNFDTLMSIQENLDYWLELQADPETLCEQITEHITGLLDTAKEEVEDPGRLLDEILPEIGSWSLALSQLQDLEAFDVMWPEYPMTEDVLNMLYGTWTLKENLPVYGSNEQNGRNFLRYYIQEYKHMPDPETIRTWLYIKFRDGGVNTFIEELIDLDDELNPLF